MKIKKFSDRNKTIDDVPLFLIFKAHGGYKGIIEIQQAKQKKL